MAVFSSDGEDEERLKTYILIHQKRFHSGPKNYRDTAILRRSYTKSYNPLLSTDDLKRADRFRRVQHPEAEPDSSSHGSKAQECCPMTLRDPSISHFS